MAPALPTPPTSPYRLPRARYRERGRERERGCCARVSLGLRGESFVERARWHSFFFSLKGQAGENRKFRALARAKWRARRVLHATLISCLSRVYFAPHFLGVILLSVCRSGVSLTRWIYLRELLCTFDSFWAETAPLQEMSAVRLWIYIVFLSCKVIVTFMFYLNVLTLVSLFTLLYSSYEIYMYVYILTGPISPR